MEIWKDIPGYEGLYQVSNYGRVKSLERLVKNGKDRFYLKKETILKQSMTTTGYKMVNFSVNKKVKYFKVHRLVMAAFFGESQLIVNHMDGNPINNHISNLEYCTQAENLEHALNTGLRKSYRIYEKEILDDYKIGMSVNQIVDKYKTSFKSINHLLDKNGLKKRKRGSFLNKYNIDLEELKDMFDAGIKNKEIANYFNTNTSLIARRKYQYKKGEI